MSNVLYWAAMGLALLLLPFLFQGPSGPPEERLEDLPDLWSIVQIEGGQR